MKNRKNRVLALVLTLVLALGLAAPALAYSTPDFSDLPADNWAYAPVMRMADQGIIQGTGNGMFSPELKVSVAQFLTLVGRIVFPETTVGVNDTWYGPHVAACQKAGFLTGTQVNVNDVEAEITRYDMAVILRAAAKKLGKTETLAQSSQVTDYGMVPTMYADAVLAVYGMGLITGDQNGNFNGANTMQRNELATVIDRLVALKAPSGTTEPEKPTETEQPTEPIDDPLVEYVFKGYVRQTEHAMAAPAFDKHTYIPGATVKLYYTPDGGKTSTLVAEGTATEGTLRELPNGVSFLVDAGDFTFTFEAPESWGDGQNFYVSAEGVYEGQKLVSSDLRTDGRAYKSLLKVAPGPSMIGSMNRVFSIEMTPPNGEKAKLTYKGFVRCETATGERRPEGFTVQLHFKDGTVLGEAVTDANGNFTMDFEVDALDDPFDPMKAQYYATLDGIMDGVHYNRIPRRDGEIVLRSLEELGVCIPEGNGKWHSKERSLGFSLSNAVSP